MRLALLEFNLDHGGSRPKVPAWYPIAGVGFALLSIGVLVYLVIGPDIATGKKVLVDALLAFCAACSSTFFGGDAAAKGQLPIPFAKIAPVQFSALGGFAVFVIVFLLTATVK